MTLPSWPAMSLFVAQACILALYGLTVSGHFPAEHRMPSLRTAAGATLLWGTIAVALCAGGTAVMLAARTLPWAAAVIGAGAAILFAPLILQSLPDSFVDSRRGLILLAGAAGLLAILSLRMT